MANYNPIWCDLYVKIANGNTPCHPSFRASKEELKCLSLCKVMVAST